MYKHLFLVRPNRDPWAEDDKRFTIDSFYAWDHDKLTGELGVHRIAHPDERFTGQMPPLNALTIRARFNAELIGPLLVDNDEEISEADMQVIINGMSRERFEEFTRSAKC